jgi:hypothetical protein
MQVRVERTVLMEPPWVTWWTGRPRWCIGHPVIQASTTSTTTRSTTDTCSTSRPPLGHRHQQVRQLTSATSRIACDCCKVCVCMANALAIIDLPEYYYTRISGTFLHTKDMLALWCTWSCWKSWVGILMQLCIQRARQYTLLTPYGTKCEVYQTGVTSQSLFFCILMKRSNNPYLYQLADWKNIILSSFLLCFVSLTLLYRSLRFSFLVLVIFDCHLYK